MCCGLLYYIFIIFAKVYWLFCHCCSYLRIQLTHYQWRSQDFKVGGTPMTWPEGPWGWGFWGAFARILWPCLSTVGGACPLVLPLATLLHIINWNFRSRIFSAFNSTTTRDFQVYLSESCLQFPSGILTVEQHRGSLLSPSFSFHTLVIRSSQFELHR